MRWWGIIAACGPLVACLGVAAAPAAPARVGDLARAFEPAGEGRFVHRGASYEARLLGSSIVVAFDGGAAIEIGLGATLPAPAVGGIVPLSGRARDIGIGPWPIFDGIRYDAVRPGVALEVRALDDGIELTLVSAPGAFAGPIAWTLGGAGKDAVEVSVRGGAIIERPDGTREMRFEGTGVRGATITVVAPREGAAPAAEPVRLAVGPDGARYLAGRTRDRGFVAKLLPDDATLVWMSRFPVPEGEPVRGVEVLGDGRVLVRGAATLSADGSVIALERGAGADAEPPLPGPSPFGPTARRDAVMGRVTAGVTSERRLPGATIAVPLESGDSAFLATRSAGCPGTINFDNSAGALGPDSFRRSSQHSSSRAGQPSTDRRARSEVDRRAPGDQSIPVARNEPR